MVSAIAAKYSEINIPQQSTERVKKKKISNFVWIFWASYLFKDHGRWLFSPHGVTSHGLHLCALLWSIFCEARNQAHTRESHFTFCRRSGKRGVGGRGVRSNQLKITIRKRIFKKIIIPTDLIFLSLCDFLSQPADSGEGRGLTQSIWILRAGNGSLAAFRAGVSAAREWIASLAHGRSSRAEAGLWLSRGDVCESRWLRSLIASAEQRSRCPRPSPRSAGRSQRTQAQLWRKRCCCKECCKEWVVTFCCLAGELESKWKCFDSLPITLGWFQCLHELQPLSASGLQVFVEQNISTAQMRRKVWTAMTVWWLEIFIVTFITFIKYLSAMSAEQEF